MSPKDLQTIENIKWDPPFAYDPISGWKKSSINVKNYGRMIHSSKVRFRFLHCQVSTAKHLFFFKMTMCRNVRNTAVKENKDYTATTSLRLKSCPTMAKPMVTHHASHPCANPVSVRSRKNKKTKQVEINRMWLQPPNTMKLAAGFDALVGCERSNTFSKKRTAACVWTCLHRLWLCNSFMRKPQGTERVCLIPGTDRGLAGGNCNLSKLSHNSSVNKRKKN